MSSTHFDREASSWDENPQNRERTWSTFRILNELCSLQDNMNCLDFGCGTGMLSFLLQDKVSHITLLDSSRGMLQVVQNRIKEKAIQNMDTVFCDESLASCLDRRDFDMIWAVMSLHHITDLAAVIRTFSDISTPRAKLLIFDLEPEDGSFHAHHQNYTGHNGLDPVKLEQYCFSAAYQTVSSDRYFTIQRTQPDGSQKTYPLFYLLAQK